MIVVDRKKEIRDYKGSDSAANRYNYKNNKSSTRSRKNKARKNPRSKKKNHLRKNRKRNNNINDIKGKRNNRNKRNASEESWFNATFMYMISYALIIGIIVIFGILYINKYVEMSKINFKINQAQSEIESLKTSKRKVKLKIAQYKSLDRVEKIAKNDLGMVEPDKINFITMKDNTNLNTSTKSRKGNEITGKFNKINELGYKISTWFKDLTQVEAGTLEK